MRKTYFNFEADITDWSARQVASLLQDLIFEMQSTTEPDEPLPNGWQLTPTKESLAELRIEVK